jgi:hypothetical protein
MWGNYPAIFEVDFGSVRRSGTPQLFETYNQHNFLF